MILPQDSHTHDGKEYGAGCPICLENIELYHSVCFDCGDPADDYLIDENEYGEHVKLPICRACRFDRFGKDNEEY